MPPRWQCTVCGRLYDAMGYLSPTEAPDEKSRGMCPPCADQVFAAERDRLAAEDRPALAAEWETERQARQAAAPHWFPAGGDGPVRA